MSEAVITPALAADSVSSVKGMKKNGNRGCAYGTTFRADQECAGKQWHDNKTAFRPRANQTSWDKRTADRKALAAVKAKEKELKAEKEAERQASFARACMFAY